MRWRRIKTGLPAKASAIESVIGVTGKALELHASADDFCSPDFRSPETT